MDCLANNIKPTCYAVQVRYRYINMERDYISLNELMGRDYPPTQWLVDKLIPAGAITVISAAPASYKTWLLLDIANAVSAGTPLFDVFKTKQGKVVFLDEESGEEALHNRLKSLGLDPNQSIHFKSRKGFKATEENVDELLDDCLKNDVKLVIIDTLIQIHSSDENNPNDMTNVFKLLSKLTGKGITVVIAHHNRKAGSKLGGAGDEMRGSSGILAAVECHIAIKRQARSRAVTIEQTKNKMDEEMKPFKVVMEGDTQKGETITFQYKGDMLPLKTTEETLRETIFTLVANNDGELCQGDLLVLLDEAKVPTNEHKLRSVLTEMVKANELVIVKGTGNTKNYRLGSMAPDQDEETPEAE